MQIESNLSYQSQISNYINRAVTDSFHQIFNEHPQINNYIVFQEKLKILGDFLGVVDLKSKGKTSGFFASIFPKETLIPFLAEIYGKNIIADQHKLKDAVGELTNIIFCIFKQSVNSKLDCCWEMSLPKVQVNNSEIKFEDKSLLVMSFKSSHGPFSMAVSI